MIDIAFSYCQYITQQYRRLDPAILSSGIDVVRNNHFISFETLVPAYRPGHPQTVAIFEALAEGFNVNVTEDHRRYWRNLLIISRAIDTTTDTESPESLQHESELLTNGQSVAGVSDDEAREFSAFIQTLSAERQATIQQGLAITSYAAAMRSTRGYTQFMQLRTEEAELFGAIMRLDNPDGTPEIDAFNRWLPKFARAGYLIDSFGDFSQDYKDGQIALRPTLSRRLRIAKVALSETKQAISDLPPRTISFLAVASLSKMARNGLSKIK